MNVVIIGGGQAGLSVSHYLAESGVEHVVLERERVGQAWRGRWDSFSLVTPNWTMGLPGKPYVGDDPEGHVRRDEIVAHLEGYATGKPVREGVTVHAVRPRGGRYELDTSDGPTIADVVIVCTGTYSTAYRPEGRTSFPAGLLVLDATQYRNPGSIPDGKILVIGSGQTGIQFAEELHLAGREVFLSCGRAPWVPRRLGELDIVTWLMRTPFFDTPLSALPMPTMRFVANPQTTGANGGHDLHYRTLQALGVPLLGRLAGVDGRRADFADDLASSVAFGDARWAELRALLEQHLPRQGFEVPDLPVPEPFVHEPIIELDLRDFSAVLVTSGFRPDYGWIDLPVCDGLGFPLTVDGASTVSDGLYFCGVHFMRVRRSSFMFGVGDDAKLVAASIAARFG